MDSNKLKYRLVKAEDVKETSELLANAFYTREPAVPSLVQNIGYVFNRENTVSKGAQQQLSILCEDISQPIGERIVGVMVSSKLELIENMDKHDEFAFALNFLDLEWFRLHHPELKSNELSEKIFHLEYLAVKYGYENLGIATQLVVESLKCAKRRGFQIALVEATGYKSQRIFGEKLKFKEMNSIVYDEFEIDGRRVFKGLKNPPKCIVYEKYLDEI